MFLIFLFIYAFNFFLFAVKFINKLIGFFINFSEEFTDKVRALFAF